MSHPLIRCLSTVSLTCLLVSAWAADQPVFLDPTVPPATRITDFISRCTLEQKAALLDHKGPTVTVAGFDLRADQWNQCLNGVKWTEPTTLFPTCIAMGATWDTALVHQVAGILSDEARAIYNGWHRDPAFKGEHKGLIYRAPVINISRNPYWGRIHEVYSEDPYLTGRMAVAYVTGLQGDDPKYLKVAATLKHFAVNNVERDRQKLNAPVSERMLQEYWLPHWRDAVVEAKAQSLMASYNAINGKPNNINHQLLTDLLKIEWQHEGFVVSDLGGVRTMVQGHMGKAMSYEDAVAQSVMAGCDFSDKEYREFIPAAVKSGKLTTERLDDALRRVLTVRLRLGEFDPQESQPWSRLSPDIIASAPHRALSLKAAQEAIVLLQNRDHLLPLDPATVHSIAVIGPQSDRITSNNYNGRYRNAVTTLAGLRNRAGSGIEISHAVGGLIAAKDGWVKDDPPQGPIDTAVELAKAVELARTSDVAVVVVGTNSAIEHEGRDRTDLGLPGNQEQLVEAVFAANPRTIVVEMSAGPLTVPWIKTHIPAVLQAWWPGEEGGNAIADVLLGRVNPAGRLPYTVYSDAAQVPSQDEYDVTKGFTYLYLRGDPLFAFGHGLSYTTFAYAGATVSQPTASERDTLQVGVTVNNTGTRNGDEVVQVYVREPAGTVVKPHRRLVGFQRMTIPTGGSIPVTIPVQVARMRIWDEASHRFVLEPGTYTLEIGASSADIRQSVTFRVER